jgi:hypothetical protein
MATYRIVPIESNKIQQMSRAQDVASFLYGRRTSAYIVIKSDERGHRVVDLESANGDILVLQIRLADA